MKGDTVNTGLDPVHEAGGAADEVLVDDFGGEADIGVGVFAISTNIDTVTGNTVFLLQTVWSLSSEEKGRARDVLEVLWQNGFHGDVLMGVVAEVGVLVLSLDLNLITNLGINVVMPGVVTKDTDLLRDAEVGIEDRFDADSDIAGVLVTARDNAIKDSVPVSIFTVVVVTNHLAALRSFGDEGVIKGKTLGTDTVVLKESGIIDVFQVEVASTLEVDVAIVFTRLAGFVWISVSVVRADDTVDADGFGRLFRNAEGNLHALSDVLSVFVVVVDIEANDVFLAVFDGDGIVFPFVLFARLVFAIILASTDEVFLIAEVLRVANRVQNNPIAEHMAVDLLKRVAWATILKATVIAPG